MVRRAILMGIERGSILGFETYILGAAPAIADRILNSPHPLVTHKGDWLRDAQKWSGYLCPVTKFLPARYKCFVGAVFLSGPGLRPIGH